ncbi:hypothetical protein [Sphingomonas sp. HMP9]|uniref:hypothetical protein n=1 Tax=Sphingomonas sp. HMP9 TaxID=1517554 RepID=UPI001596AC78
MTRRDVPYTNNGSERALRMSVIFRKVTSYRRYMPSACGPHRMRTSNWPLLPSDSEIRTMISYSQLLQAAPS